MSIRATSPPIAVTGTRCAVACSRSHLTSCSNANFIETGRRQSTPHLLWVVLCLRDFEQGRRFGPETAGAQDSCRNGHGAIRGLRCPESLGRKLICSSYQQVAYLLPSDVFSADWEGIGGSRTEFPSQTKCRTHLEQHSGSPEAGPLLLLASDCEACEAF